MVEGNEDVWFVGQKTHRSIITVSKGNIVSKRTCLFFTSLKSRKKMCVKGSGRWPWAQCKERLIHLELTKGDIISLGSEFLVSRGKPSNRDWEISSEGRGVKDRLNPCGDDFNLSWGAG